MFAKHLTVPHRFVCVTDDPVGMYTHYPDIETVLLWPSPQPHADNRHWLFNYNRLRLFDPWAAEAIGERILCSDLDIVIRGNIDHLIKDDHEPFRILALKSRIQLQGGFFYVEPGRVSPNPWAALHEDPTIFERARKWVGSDQAVLSELFYGKVPTWDEDDGLIINQYDWPDWRVLFRTGTHKCWAPHQPEFADYMRESEPVAPAPLVRMEVRTDPRAPHSLVRRYIVRR